MTARVRTSCAAASAGRSPLDELVDLYDEGTGWCTDLAVERRARRAVRLGRARRRRRRLRRYLRAASDYAGGRRLED